MGSRRSSAALRARLTTYAEEHDLEIVFFDPPEHFDHAIVGLIHGFGQEPAVLYDQEKVLTALAKDLGIEGAEEWFDYNTIGAYVGEATPRFLIAHDVYQTAIMPVRRKRQKSKGN